MESLMDAVCRRVVIDYPAHAASVEVFVHPPSETPDARPPGRLQMMRTYAEIVDSLSETEIAELGAGRWAASSPSDRWRLVVIHHSATDSGSAAAFDRYHRDEKGWDGLGYHFVIGNGRGSADGLVEVGRRWRLQEDGAHAGVAEANRVGIGVCLVGNFGKTLPTAAQMASLRCLCRWLHAECRMPYSSIVGHRDIKATDCPGKGFPMAELIEELGRPAGSAGAASPEARQGRPPSEPSPR